jgi:hypothetical protein
MIGSVALAIFVTEVISVVYAAKEVALAKRKEILTYGRRMPRSIPVLDDQIKKKIGPTSKLQRLSAQFTIKGVRNIVNTRAFEHAVQAAINKRSIKSKAEVRLCL